jgi:hypothetical protein
MVIKGLKMKGKEMSSEYSFINWLTYQIPDALALLRTSKLDTSDKEVQDISDELEEIFRSLDKLDDKTQRAYRRLNKGK